jgi:hypothetical protein
VRQQKEQERRRGREGGKEGGREGGKEGRREGGKEGRREGGPEYFFYENQKATLAFFRPEARGKKGRKGCEFRFPWTFLRPGAAIFSRTCAGTPRSGTREAKRAKRVKRATQF